MLNYTKVLELLINSGLIPNLPELKYPGIIIQFGSAVLKQLGLIISDHFVLLVTKENDEFVFYEKNNTEPFGDGDEGWIWSGVNIKTGDEVAIKSQYRSTTEISNAYVDLPEGWRLSKERLNQYPYFAKTYTSGFVYEIQETLLTAMPVKYGARSSLVKINQIMERISVGYKLIFPVYFSLWSGAKKMQLIVDALNAYEAMHKENIEGFDHYTPNYLVDKNGRLKLCDFNPLFQIINSDNSSKPNFRNAINLLFVLYTSYTYQGNARAQAASKLISDTIKYFQDNYPMPKEVLMKKLVTVITELEKQECIIQCEQENTLELNASKTNITQQLGISSEEFCSVICQEINLVINQTIQDRIANFVIPQTKIAWKAVAFNVVQSTGLTFSTEFIKDGLKYYSAPRWLPDVVDHVIKDSWMWSQGSAYSAVATSVSTELCGYLGLSNNVKAAIGIATGICTNAVLQYPATTIATSVVSSVASIFASTITFWSEKKLANKMGIINNAERLTFFKPKQQRGMPTQLIKRDSQTIQPAHSHSM